MNLGGIDYVKVWTPWRERFLWFPERIKLSHPTVVGDRAVYKWTWLRTVYYRESSYSNLADRDIDYIPAIVEVEYAMNIFDILRSKD
jgi:hypothetical protein